MDGRELLEGDEQLGDGVGRHAGKVLLVLQEVAAQPGVAEKFLEGLFSRRENCRGVSQSGSAERVGLFNAFSQKEPTGTHWGRQFCL